MSVEGSGSNQPIKQQQYVQEAQLNLQRFEQNLAAYTQGEDNQVKVNSQQVMESSMQLIQAALSEINQSGIQKQGDKVASDFKEYMSSGSDDSLTNLNQDIATLRQYLQES